MLNFLRIALAVTVVLAFGGRVPAMEGPGADVRAVAETWAAIKYQQEGDPHRLRNVLTLEEETAALSERFPGDAEPLFWQANTLCLAAELTHSLGSLEKVWQARTLLERAEVLDPGSSAIVALLGSLYYEVPGWPIGFGNKGKAAALLRRALEMDPDSMDANFFMGDLLLQRGNPQEAAFHLEKALATSRTLAPSPIVDGRREEILKGLSEARRRIH